MSRDLRLLSKKSKKYIWIGQSNHFYYNDDWHEKLSKFLLDTMGEELVLVDDNTFPYDDDCKEVLSLNEAIEEMGRHFEHIKNSTHTIALKNEILNILLDCLHRIDNIDIIIKK